ncbi:MAG: energy transducer TonB [candidate division Zixibacteria bacterium]|nr:energy transducer TonB [candidate division Zixibacteria bacterium]
MRNHGKANQSAVQARVLPYLTLQNRRIRVLVAAVTTLMAIALLWAAPSYGTTVTGESTSQGDSAVMLDSLPDMNTFIPVDTQPELVYRHPPEYPRIAENARITGRVYLKTLIDESGEVLKSAVLKSSGNVWLDRAAKKAAAKNKYKPAIYQGKPILYWATYKVDFVLGD